MNEAIEQLIHDVLHGEASETQCQQLSQWIAENEANAQAYLRIAMDERAIRSSLERDAARSLEELAESPDDSNAGMMLAELAKQEAQAEVDLVTLVGEVSGLHGPSPTPSAHDFAEAGRYIFEHAIANKRFLYTAGSAIAAVLLIALSLVFVFSGGPDEPVVDPLADIELWDTTPKHLPVVATLTDAVGAQWRSDDKPVPMPMGAQLVAFERYTLTHGFAEITTRRGATALLQAPCTIELTDHDNAIRLHSGKLVGKCETPLSKGFIVHAPGMDVVDLGTQFGVAADSDGASTVLVMDGSVRAQPAETSQQAFRPVVLGKNQARRVVPETGSLEMIAVSESPVFHSEPVHPYVAMVMDAQPLAYWRFESTSGAVITNQANTDAFDLQVNGSAKLVENGFIGRGGSLDNIKQVDGYFDTAQAFESIGSEGDFTFSLWCRIDHDGYTSGTGTSIGGFYTGKPQDNHHLAQIDIHAAVVNDKLLNGTFRVHYNDPRFVLGHQGLQSESQYKQGQWQHIALTRSGQTLRLYIDGQAAGEHIVESIKPADSALFVIGRSMSLPRWLKQSSIDEVAVYDRALTLLELNKHREAAGVLRSP